MPDECAAFVTAWLDAPWEVLSAAQVVGTRPAIVTKVKHPSAIHSERRFMSGAPVSHQPRPGSSQWGALAYCHDANFRAPFVSCGRGSDDGARTKIARAFCDQQTACKGWLRGLSRRTVMLTLSFFRCKLPIGARVRRVSQTSLLALVLAELATACSGSMSREHDAVDPGSDEPADAPKPPIIPEVPDPVLPEFDNLTCAPITPVLTEGRLLTRAQYQNTINDLFRGQVQGQWTASFPAENEVFGFRTSAEFHRATPWLAEAQMVASEAVAASVRANLATIAPCAAAPSQALRGEALNAALQCARDYLATYGFRAVRRPLTAAEEQPYLDLFEEGATTQGSAYGIELVTQALLQSPQFLYRLEMADSPDAGNGIGELVDSFGLASRLSYLFWNSMPDDELFAVAQAGTLVQPDVLRAQAERLLNSPKAQSALFDFTEQWLNLAALNGAVRNGVGTPTQAGGEVTEPARDAGASTQYSSAWRTSVQTFVSALYASGATFGDLMSSPDVYVNRALAPVYGVTLPEGTPDGAFVRVEMPAGERAGLLTQPGLMALLAHSDQSAPILRGVFVRDKILCQPTPSAPPSVDPTPPMLDPNATTRERFAQHTSNPGCASCHNLIDPIGLGLENYDELGRYRATENGLDIDPSGALKGLREQELEGEFTGAVGLAEKLSGSVQAQTCFVTQWYRYGMGRVEQAEDLCSIRDMVETLVSSGGDLRQMLLRFVDTDAFRYRTLLDPTLLDPEEQAAGEPAP